MPIRAKRLVADFGLMSQLRVPHASLPVLLITGLYLLASIVFTYPLIFNFDSGLYGYPGDSTLTIGDMGAGRLATVSGTPKRELSGAPFGVDDSQRIVTPYSYLVAALMLLRNEVFAYNFFTFVSFPLSALAAYALAYKITRKHTASFVAGLIYSFGPYHQWHARQHFGYDPQWMPLFLLSLWHFEERPSPRRALLAGGAYSVVAIVNAYHGFFAAVAGIALVLCRAVYHRWGRPRRSFLSRARLAGYALASAFVLALISWTYWPAIRAIVFRPQAANPTAVKPYQRAAWWPFYLSARPWDYLLPSEDHPLFGKFMHDTYEWIGQIDRGDWVPEAYRYLQLDNDWFWDNAGPVERTIFLGYTGLALSAYIAWRVWKERRAQPTEARFGIFFFLSLFLIAVWFSAPPFFPIGSLLITRLPAWAQNWIIPFPLWFWFQYLHLPFRASVRFGVLALLGVAVLAAAGLSDLLDRLKSRRGRMLLVGGASLLVLFEFASLPPFTRIYPAPEVYQWLAAQPGEEIVASYPWNYDTDVVYQSVHGKRLIGHTFDALDMMMNRLLGDLSYRDAAPKLAALGVKYVLWHTRDPYSYSNVRPFWNGDFSQLPITTIPPGLSLRAAFDTAQVFEVVAEPAELVVLFTPQANVWVSNPQWRWQAPRQSLWVWNPTSQIIRLDVELGLESKPASGSLVAALELTPPPEQILVDGSLAPNPLANLRYDATRYRAALVMADPPRLRFASLPILPGESRLTFSWEQASPSYPIISGLSVQLVAGP